jgi:hypothetical protein
MTSKVPGYPPSSCICAQGYETNKEQCSACAANTFKAVSGPGLCIQCPIGMIAPVKASACILDTGVSANQNTSSSPDFALLLGGVGGGIIGLIIIIYIIQKVMNTRH